MVKEEIKSRRKQERARRILKRAHNVAKRPTTTSEIGLSLSHGVVGSEILQCGGGSKCDDYSKISSLDVTSF